MTATLATPIMGRPADSTKRIVLDLRGQILAGELAPGAQMPTRVEIERQFGAGKATVQRALEELRRDGFVDVNGKQGTYVSHYPPHLARYAIIFPDLPTNSGWNRFFEAMSQIVATMDRSQSRPATLQLPIYCGVNNDHSSEVYFRLEREVRAHCVAGLIFMSNPYMLRNTSLLEEFGMPRVAIGGSSLGGVTDVILDASSFKEKALAYLKSRGRRRVAVIGPPAIQDNWTDWTVRIRAHEMQSEPYWSLSCSQRGSEGARNIVHLLMSGTPQQRPDGLIIQDDNLVDHALEGLGAAGMRIPEDVEVVAHSNFPLPTTGAPPVQRLGYDARKVIGACIESIDRQRKGEAAVPSTHIAAQFVAEIKQ